VSRSCACAAGEKKCDRHAGTWDFGMGIGLVSCWFCAAGSRLGRLEVEIVFGVKVKEDNKRGYSLLFD
jgi:hypothetical protein